MKIFFPRNIICLIAFLFEAVWLIAGLLQINTYDSVSLGIKTQHYPFHRDSAALIFRNEQADCNCFLTQNNTSISLLIHLPVTMYRLIIIPIFALTLTDSNQLSLVKALIHLTIFNQLLMRTLCNDFAAVHYHYGIG